ncbi:hypothetical protein [Devosia naphthalenivorans]|uniref:hypothetical protein n=1 Tax=Devosia naphthalenivorans TaxID=2082392 RepID=UPI000D392C44|nr:hypothetical protein [Devosia naphthalenivorans]
MTKKNHSSETPTVAAEVIDRAITEGKAVIAAGKPKIDAAMSIYVSLVGESQETVVSAFIEGASLTPKGAVTYWYNCRRKHRRIEANDTK